MKRLETLLRSKERELARAEKANSAQERESKHWQARLDAVERELAQAKKRPEGSILRTEERLLREMAGLRAQFEELLARHVEVLQGSIYDLQAEADEDPEKPEYRKVVRRLRETVRDGVPPGATILVVSKGDENLVNLYGRRAWHFPRAESGEYAGYHPKSDLSAIAHLEALRAQGADHILFPATAFWWLDYYPQLMRHLEERYRCVVNDDSCALFALEPAPDSPTNGWKNEFRDFLDEYRLSFGRDPAILDLHTGFDLAQQFPEHVVFAPPAERNGLPYLDDTIDIVAVLQSKAAHVAEANRVASAAVLAFSSARRNGQRLDARWKVEPTEQPSVSIVIPCYDGLKHTDACLSSLRETLPRTVQCEIVVVDDASQDGTAARLDELEQLDERIKVVRNTENLGFLQSSNRGAEAAIGDVLVFLNNDTILLPRWLEPLLRVFAEHEDVGVVGGRLVYPDGTLQEAGGLVFADGSAWKYGYREPDPANPLFSFFRKVDYCSGCLFATRRSLFTELGGFDAGYAPGFYEDTDYCFAVRKRGLHVYYEPESTIVHIEGATAGTDLERGPKRHQVLNQRKFVRKWKDLLAGQPKRPELLDATSLSTLTLRREENP